MLNNYPMGKYSTFLLNLVQAVQCMRLRVSNGEFITHHLESYLVKTIAR